MAKKTCGVCQQTYPEQLEHCPHCKTKAEVPLAEPAAHEEQLPPWIKKDDLDKSSSGEIYIDAPGIDLGAPAAKTGGGPDESDEIVEIDWSSIESESGENSSVLELGKDAYVELDSPSAQNMAVGKGPSNHPSSADIVLPKVEKTTGAGADASVPLATPVQPAGQAPPLAAKAGAPVERSKATKVVAGTHPATHLAGPADDMGHEPPAEEPTLADSSPDFELQESPAAPTAAAGNFEDLEELVEIDDYSSQTIPKPEAGKNGPEAGLGSWGEAELIDIEHQTLGEENSEVDLGSGPHRRPNSSKPSSGDVARALLGQEAHGHDPLAGESSAVDLGSTPEVGLPLSSPAGVRLDRDLAGLAADDRGGPARHGRDEDQDADALDEPAAVRLADDEEPAPRAKKKRSGMGGLVGGAVGAVLATAVCGGLWFAGIEPPASWRGVSPPANKPINPGPGNRSAVASAAQDNPRDLIDRGEFDKVLEAPAAEAQEPDALAARGEAKWRSYLAKNQPNVIVDDPAIIGARTDLAQAKTPEATLWLGQIREVMGDLPGARKIYTDALKQYQDKPGQARLFQTALNRLDALAEEPAAEEEGPKDEKPAIKKSEAPRLKKDRASRAETNSNRENLALVLVALAMETPPTNKAAPEMPEAGDYFWQAVQFAKQNKFDEAISTLDQALTTHKERRFTRQNKSQNPKSDPAEQIFIKACQELDGYWKLRKKLQDGGYLDTAQHKDPVKALDRLIAAAKADTKKDEGALKVVIDKLKQDKDVIGQDPEVKDVGKSLDLILTAKKKAATDLASLKSTLTTAKYLSESQTDPVKGLEQLLQEKKQAVDALAALKMDKGVEKLLADKKAVEDKLKDTASQLKTAEEKAKDLDAKAKTAEEKLKDTAALAKTAEDKLKDAAALTKNAEDKAKNLDAKLKVADSKTKDLADQLKVADDKLKATAARLKTADDSIKAVADKMAELISKNSKAAPPISAPAVPPTPVVTIPPAQVPEPVVSGYDPLRAEQFFNRGLTNFWARRYWAAENDFLSAVRSSGSSGRDARYFYFLGLAQFAQGKESETQVAFRQANALERNGKPGPAAVDASLERVQGPTRRYLDAFRR